MSILKIARMGHPVLAQRASAIGSAALAGSEGSEIRRLVRDMVETLSDIGGVGLAGPQVHEERRVIIFFVPPDRAPDGQGVPLTALIDPTFEPLPGGVEEGWEGCLSIPGLRGSVPRHRRIRYQGLSPEGEPIEAEAEGFHARVVQHEIDHLDGVLYPQRMVDLSRLSFEEEWHRYLLPATREQSS